MTLNICGDPVHNEFDITGEDSWMNNLISGYLNLRKERGAEDQFLVSHSISPEITETKGKLKVGSSRCLEFYDF